MDLSRIVRPQPSERWAMYRLICPVVDAACNKSRLEPFFEYSQPNGPNKRLSADIALMHDGLQTPVWIIEAKKYGRRIDPGMIDPYLNPGAMGVVTNGNQWVFKIAGKYLSIGPLLRPDGRIDPPTFEKLVAMISTVDEKSALALSDRWVATWQQMSKPSGPAVWKVSGGMGSRAYHPKTRYETLAEAAVAARGQTPSETLAAAFLDRVISSEIRASCGFFEVSQARLIWWIEERMRGLRLNLSGQHLELLVDNTLLDGLGRGNIRASIKMHDKNIRMSLLKAGIQDELVGLHKLFSVERPT